VNCKASDNSDLLLLYKLSSGRIVTMSSKFCYDPYFEAAETRPRKKPDTETR
jgi:hypothetical protein